MRPIFTQCTVARQLLIKRYVALGAAQSCWLWRVTRLWGRKGGGLVRGGACPGAQSKIPAIALVTWASSHGPSRRTEVITASAYLLPWPLPSTGSIFLPFGCGPWPSVLSAVLSRFGHVQLFATPYTVARRAPLSMGFSKQGYWSGLPWSPPGDIPDPGIQSTCLIYPTLVGGFFITSATWTG